LFVLHQTRALLITNSTHFYKGYIPITSRDFSGSLLSSEIRSSLILSGALISS
jgi:hypothetical protein